MRGNRFVAGWAALCLLLAQCILVPAAQAAMIGTQMELGQQERAAKEERIMTLVQREEARSTLEKYGVAPADIEQRLDRLSDEQVSQLAKKADELPAGQSVLGFVLAVFLILILLDLLGVTNIFPAIQPAS